MPHLQQKSGQSNTAVRLSRRGFLLALGTAGGSMALSPPFGRTESAVSELQLASRTGHALGAEVSITLLHPQRPVAEQAMAAAFVELGQVDELLSLYRPTSQVSQLNRRGALSDPHPFLLEVLRKAQVVSEKSGGAFDVTVQPLWELYAAAKKQGKLPDDQAVQAARQKVDWRQIEISPQRIALGRPGMAITLNAIAQGYAADRVLTVLRRHGIAQALVNTGEIGTLGRRVDGTRWTVGIQHPRRPDAYVALAGLDGQCLSTSGDYATSFSDDRLYNHIFDPATGRSPERFSSVTVVAPSGADADALSTALFVLGQEKGLKLIEAWGSVEAMLVFKDGKIVATKGFPAM